ncbi:MAG TPA: RelA/SpoT domain-containing protein [Vicinamibacterales bacterium]|nr:RelA/SpoT domain-containing protein [Vicinamibacterales bacterium]
MFRETERIFGQKVLRPLPSIAQDGEGWDDMAEWVSRDHSKGEIDRAGTTLRNWWGNLEIRRMQDMTEDERNKIGNAWGICSNWRSSHAMPLLSFRMGLTHRARKVQSESLIAQRVKRMPSILNKLVREPAMQLSQMQDLGGCRAIMADVESVYRVFDLYRGSSEQGLFDEEIANSLKCYDYIRNPKADGYRGIHVVGRYRPRFEKHDQWSGNRIEIQLRTQLQHTLATTVETVTTFTRKPLKFGGGPEMWRRFFALSGSAFALVEGTPLIPGTPQKSHEIVQELRALSKELRVKQRLKAWTRALKTLPRRNLKGAKWLLLILDVERNTIKVTGFSDRMKAAAANAAIEQSPRAKHLDAVLAWVPSAKTLRAAYPNYYADTRVFLASLESVLER